MQRDQPLARPQTSRQLALERWLAGNGEAIKASNRYVETHDLPLARYRQF
ncbi:type II toxin-antitoxin system CcdA family antitoxin [Sphingomonas sp.]